MIYPHATKISNREPERVPIKLDSKANLLVNKQQNSLLILQCLSGKKCRFLKTENSVFLFQNLTCLSLECFSRFVLSCNARQRCVMVKIGCEGDLDFEKRESSSMDGLPKNFLRQQPCENNTIYKVDTISHNLHITSQYFIFSQL